MKSKSKLLLTAFILIFSFKWTIYAQKFPKSSPETIELTEEEENFIKNHHILNVACETSWPPFEYYDTSLKLPKHTGINIEILRVLALKAGIELNFIPTDDYTESIGLMRNGKIDILTGFVEKADSLDNIQLTDVLYSLKLLLASTTGNMPQLGDTICMAEFGPKEMEEIYKIFPPNKFYIKTFDYPELALQELKSGRCNHIIIGPYELADYPALPAYTTFPLDIAYYQQYALSKDLGTTALNIFNKAIHSLSQDEFETIIFKNQSERLYYLREKNYVNATKRASMHYTIAVTIIVLGIASTLTVLLIKKQSKVLAYDELTGLPALNNFKRLVREKLRNASPNEYILVSLDIDNFKLINDTYGFSRGNLILVELCQHFKDNISLDEVITRFYADNFILFTKNPNFLVLIEDKVFKLTMVEDHIRKLLPEHYKLTFSSGVYYISDPHSDIASMIDKANLARHQGKDSYTTKRVTEYTAEMEQKSNWDKEVLLTMDKAFKNHEFEVYYQPKFYLSNEKVLGAEALIRWNHPEKGLLPPDTFIPLFEHNGFIQKIDIYVFDKVCKFLSEWNKMGKDGTCPCPLTISFNLSRYHLTNPNIIQLLTTIFNKYNVSPSHVEVELTESIMFDNPKLLIRIMNEIKKAGFSISVDDFGSGYSSLNLLKDMPADVLKLDKEFLSKVNDEGKDTIIISSVIEMAKKLKMTTVAEGIETKIQSELLRDMGCDIAQGYYYARPMKEKDFLALLKSQYPV